MNYQRQLFLSFALIIYLIPLAFAENVFTRADQQGIEWIYEDLESTFLVDVMEICTRAGDSQLLLAGSLLLTTYGSPTRARTGKLLTTALGSTGVAVYGLKHLFGRDRPFEIDSGDSSFPSGHASMSFAAATVLGKEYPGIRIPLYTAAGIVGFSRIYLGRHYPSDVLAGMFLGTAIGYLTHRYQGYILKIEF